MGGLLGQVVTLYRLSHLTGLTVNAMLKRHPAQNRMPRVQVIDEIGVGHCLDSFFSMAQELNMQSR